MYDSRRKRSQKRHARSSSSFGDIDTNLLGRNDQPLERYIDESGQERVVVGIHDDNAHDPQAEIFDQKGETTVVDLSRQRAIRMCAPDKHVMVDDPSEAEEGFQAEKCRYCPYGRLVAGLREPEGKK